MKAAAILSAHNRLSIPGQLFSNLQASVTPPAGQDVEPSKIAAAISHVYEAVASGKSASINVYGTIIDNAYVLAQLSSIGAQAPKVAANHAVVWAGDIVHA